MDEIFCVEEGKGQPIILIHGFCETSEIWNDFSSHLADSNKVYSIDLPGCGQSKLPRTPFSIDDIARLLIDWMHKKKIENPVLIGHSLGGYVALSMCEQIPEKIRGLVLFHSTAFPDSDERRANRNKVIDFVNSYGVAPFADTFVPGLFSEKNHPSIPMVDRIAQGTKPKTLVSYAQAMRDRPSHVDFLKDFDKPFLVLGGKWDQIIPQSITEELGNLGKNSSSSILSNAAHMGMLEQPDDAIKTIKDFISQL